MDIELRRHFDGSYGILRNDWTDSSWQRIAAQFAVILQTDVTLLNPDEPHGTGHNGFRVKTVGGFYTQVIPMIANWRICLVPVDAVRPVDADPRHEDPNTYRYWCIGGRDMVSLALAMGQAALFDGSPEWAPIGFSRAWDRHG